MDLMNLEKKKRNYVTPETALIILGDDLMQSNLIETSPVVTPWKEDDGGEVDFEEAKRMYEFWHTEDSLLYFITRDQEFKFKKD